VTRDEEDDEGEEEEEDAEEDGASLYQVPDGPSFLTGGERVRGTRVPGMTGRFRGPRHRHDLASLRGGLRSTPEMACLHLGKDSRFLAGATADTYRLYLPDDHCPTDPVERLQLEEALRAEAIVPTGGVPEDVSVLVEAGSVRATLAFRVGPRPAFTAGGKMGTYSKPKPPSFKIASDYGEPSAALDSLVAFDSTLRAYARNGAFFEAWMSIQEHLEGVANHVALPLLRRHQEILAAMVAPSESFYRGIIDVFRNDLASCYGISATIELRLYEGRSSNLRVQGTGSSVHLRQYLAALRLHFMDLMSARRRLASGEVFEWDQMVGTSSELRRLIDRARMPDSSAMPAGIASKLESLLLTDLTGPERMSFQWLATSVCRVAKLEAEREFEDEGLPNLLDAATSGHCLPCDATTSGGGGGGPGKLELVFAPKVTECRVTRQGDAIYCDDPNHRRGGHYAALHGITKESQSKKCADPRCNGRPHPVVGGRICCPNALNDKLDGPLFEGAKCDAIIFADTGMPANPGLWTEAHEKGRAQDLERVKAGKPPLCSYMVRKKGKAEGPKGPKGARKGKGDGKGKPKPSNSLTVDQAEAEIWAGVEDRVELPGNAICLRTAPAPVLGWWELLHDSVLTLAHTLPISCGILWVIAFFRPQGRCNMLDAAVPAQTARAPIYVKMHVGSVTVPAYCDPGAWVGYDVIDRKCVETLLQSSGAKGAISPIFQLPTPVPVSFGKASNEQNCRDAVKIKGKIVGVDGKTTDVTETYLVVSGLNNPGILLGGETLVYDLKVSYGNIVDKKRLSLGGLPVAICATDSEHNPSNASPSRPVKLAAFAAATIGLTLPPAESLHSTCTIQPSAKAVRDGIGFLPILADLDSEGPTNVEPTSRNNRAKDGDFFPVRDHFVIQPVGSVEQIEAEVEDGPNKPADWIHASGDDADPIGQALVAAEAALEVEDPEPRSRYDEGTAVLGTALPTPMLRSVVYDSRTMRSAKAVPAQEVGFADSPSEGEFDPHSAQWEWAKHKYRAEKQKEAEAKSPFAGHGSLTPKTCANNIVRRPVEEVVQELQAERLAASLPEALPLNLARYKAQARPNCFDSLDKEIQEKLEHEGKVRKWDTSTQEWRDCPRSHYAKESEAANLSAEFKDKILAAIDKNATAFYDEGCNFPALEGVECNFHVKPQGLGHSVRRLSEPLRLSPYAAKCLDFLFKQQAEWGLFRKWDGSESNRPIFTSPAFIAPRKNSVIGRIVIDYRAVNKALYPVPLPSPNADAIYDASKGYRFYFASDLSLAYNLVKLGEETQRLLAVCTKTGIYFPTRLPLGPSPAPGYFQDVIQRIFGDITTVFIDDIGFGEDEEEAFLERLGQVFEKCQSSGARLSVKKTHIGVPSIECLGHVVSSEGLSPCPKKLFQIRSWPLPQTKEELNSFVCVVRYLGLFTSVLPDVAARLKPYELGKVPFADFARDDQAPEAFHALKALISDEAVPTEPDFGRAANYSDRPFEVFTDASLHRYAWAICQRNDDGSLRIWKRHSKTFQEARQRWSALERELFAIVSFIEEGYPLIKGHKWLSYTDHKNLGTKELASIAANKTTAGKILRWCHSIARELATGVRVYLKGESNVIADALSRLAAEDVSAIGDLASTMPRIRHMLELISTQPQKLDEIMASRRLNSAHSKTYVPPFSAFACPETDLDDPSPDCAKQPSVGFINSTLVSQGACMRKEEEPATKSEEPRSSPEGPELARGRGKGVSQKIFSQQGKGFLNATVPDVCPEVSLEGDSGSAEPEFGAVWDGGVMHLWSGCCNPLLPVVGDGGDASPLGEGLGSAPDSQPEVEIARVEVAAMDWLGKVLIQKGESGTLPGGALENSAVEAARGLVPGGAQLSEDCSTVWQVPDGSWTQLFGVRVDKSKLSVPSELERRPWLEAVEKPDREHRADAFRRLMAQLPFPSTSRRFAGIMVPRRIYRKTDKRGDNFVISGSLDDRAQKESRSFKVGDDPRAAYDKAWDEFGRMIDRAARESGARVGLAPGIHSSAFQKFSRPPLPASTPGRVVTPCFSVSAGLDPAKFCLQGAEPCEKYESGAVSYVGKVRTVMCRRKCGRGLHHADPQEAEFALPAGPTALEPPARTAAANATATDEDSSKAVYQKAFGLDGHGLEAECHLGPQEVPILAYHDRAALWNVGGKPQGQKGTSGAFATAGRVTTENKFRLAGGETLFLYRKTNLNPAGDLASVLLLASTAARRADFVEAYRAEEGHLYRALELRDRGQSLPAIEVSPIRAGCPTAEARECVARLTHYSLDPLGLIIRHDPIHGDLVLIPKGSGTAGGMIDALGVQRPYREALSTRAHLETCRGGGGVFRAF